MARLIILALLFTPLAFIYSNWGSGTTLSSGFYSYWKREFPDLESPGGLKLNDVRESGLYYRSGGTLLTINGEDKLLLGLQIDLNNLGLPLYINSIYKDSPKKEIYHSILFSTDNFGIGLSTQFSRFYKNGIKGYLTYKNPGLCRLTAEFSSNYRYREKLLPPLSLELEFLKGLVESRISFNSSKQGINAYIKANIKLHNQIKLTPGITLKKKTLYYINTRVNHENMFLFISFRYINELYLLYDLGYTQNNFKIGLKGDYIATFNLNFYTRVKYRAVSLDATLPLSNLENWKVTLKLSS